MDDVFQTTTVRAPDAPPRSLRFVLGKSVAIHALPSEGRFVVGRGAEADVLVPAGSVSRRHAEVRCSKSGVALVDLGSANGTRVGVDRLAPNVETPIDSGDLFYFGDVAGLVLDAPATARAHYALGREELVRSVEGHLALAMARSTTFTVVMMRGEGAHVGLTLLGALAPPTADVVALSESCVATVLPGVSRDRAEALVEAVSVRISTPHSGDAVTTGGVVTHARCFPDDGMTIAELLPEESADETTRLAETTVPSIEGGRMRAIEALVERVAPTPASVLILGETGAGKEVMARRIHARSERAHGPFLALNCAALPEALLESELFGYEKGAFTGALGAKPGLIEAAGGGTLFLDELGEMPLTTQAKLLRVLEERTVMRLGALRPKAVDVRIVAATNRDLGEEIREKRFRADLYYRLNGVVITLPPLRERRDEIAPLARRFAQAAAELLKRPVPTLPAETIAALERYEWPGNVRELRNTVERLVLLATGPVLTLEHAPELEQARSGTSPAVATMPPTPIAGPVVDGPLDDAMARIERQRIVDALEQCGGNQTRAAAVLGLTRRALIGRMEKHKLPRPRR